MILFYMVMQHFVHKQNPDPSLECLWLIYNDERIYDFIYFMYIIGSILQPTDKVKKFWNGCSMFHGGPELRSSRQDFEGVTKASRSIYHSIPCPPRHVRFTQAFSSCWAEIFEGTSILRSGMGRAARQWPPSVCWARSHSASRSP